MNLLNVCLIDTTNVYKTYALQFAKYATQLTEYIEYHINNIYKRQYLHYSYLNKINERLLVINANNNYIVANYYYIMNTQIYLYDVKQRTFYINKMLYNLLLCYEKTNNNNMIAHALFVHYINNDNLKLASIYYTKQKMIPIFPSIISRMELYIKENALLCIKRFLINILYIPSYGILYKRSLASFNQLKH